MGLADPQQYGTGTLCTSALVIREQGTDETTQFEAGGAGGLHHMGLYVEAGRMRGGYGIPLYRRGRHG